MRFSATRGSDDFTAASSRLAQCGMLMTAMTMKKKQSRAIILRCMVDLSSITSSEAEAAFSFQFHPPPDLLRQAEAKDQRLRPIAVGRKRSLPSGFPAGSDDYNELRNAIN